MRLRFVGALIVLTLLVGVLGLSRTTAADVTPDGPASLPETVRTFEPSSQSLPAFPQQAPNGGPLLYLTSLDIGNLNFAVYNPATNVWTTLNPYETGCQMAVSRSGDLYAYGYNTGTIDVYDPTTDTWSPVLSVPPDASGHYCNLEITNADEFLYTQAYTTTMWYTSGGAWNSLILPFNANVMGDYDPTLDQYVIGEYGTTNAHKIDVHTWTITDYVSAVPNGEYARFGVLLNNRYYFQAASYNIHSFNLGIPALPPFDHGVSPGFFTSAAVNRPHGTIYVASLDGLSLYRFNVATNALVPLTGYGVSSYHSSLAFVPENIAYMPVVLRNVPYDPYLEENDSYSTAYGPLRSWNAYQAFPDDDNDYYYFVLSSARTVDIIVSNYAPTSSNGDLIIRDEALQLKASFGLPGQTVMRIDDLALPAGKYYVHVYTASNHSNSQLYTLQVTY